MANYTLVQDTGIVSQFHGCWKMTHAVDSLFHTRTCTHACTHTQRVKVKVIQQAMHYNPCQRADTVEKTAAVQRCVCVCVNMYGYM